LKGLDLQEMTRLRL